MKDKLHDLEQTSIPRIQACESSSALEELKLEILGKKGQLTDILKGLKDCSAEERPQIGQLANSLKERLLSQIDSQARTLNQAALVKQLEDEQLDITLPGRTENTGTLHPIEQMSREISQIFSRLGYTVATGPEIETEANNFEALNIPEHHPARDMHDTFYLNTGKLLRTHTSPVQIHGMRKHAAPLKILAPGKVYRCDADSSHSPVFHQIEGLVVDQDLSFSDLKGTLEFFLKELFGAEKKLRFRPSYFPFTTPSCEVDVEWESSKTGWLEVMGAGMVHPNVFKAVNYDPETHTGFAFGCGIDRLAMLKFGITDIRSLYENDQRLLRQF